MSIGEAIKVKETLVNAPEDRPLPDTYHARTGHLLPNEKSEVYNQLTSLNNYAKENDMKLNFKKTKLMVFNTGKSMDFMPNFQLDGNELEVVEEMKILGLILSTL